MWSGSDWRGYRRDVAKTRSNPERQQIDHATRRINRGVLSRCRTRIVDDCAGPQALVRRFEQATLDSGELGIRTRVDRAVRSDGYGGLAGLARDGLDLAANAAISRT